MINESYNDIEGILSDKYNMFLHGLDIYENRNSLIITRLVIKPEFRELGIGSEIMREITDYADANMKIIALTPSTDFGGNKNRLIQFYKNFNFKHNKGYYKSFEFKDTMIRYPKTNGAINEDTKSFIQKRLREQVELSITDETNVTTDYDILYNGMPVGILMMSTHNPTLPKDATELVLLQIKDEYRGLKIGYGVIQQIWKQNPHINKIILMPTANSIGFWSKIGAVKLNDTKYIINKKGS